MTKSFIHALIVVTAFLFVAFPNLAFSDHADKPPSRMERFTAAPKPNGTNYATQWDVGRCALLAESVAVLGWYAVPVLESLGTGLEIAKVKLTVLLKSEKAAKALLAILAILGISEGSVLEWTLGQLWDSVIEPQVQACKRVGYEFFDAARSLPTLFSRPDLYISRASDSTGIRNGRFCAESNLGYGPWDWFGGGLEGCLDCCSRKLNDQNGLERFQLSCQAVCNAQFK